MNERVNRLLWYLVSTAILVGLVYVSDYRELVMVLRGSEPRYVGLAVLCGCFTLLMWAVVWHRFFGVLGISMRFRESLRLLLAGTFLNAVTPLGRFGGEPFVAHMVARRTDATFPQALSSVSSSDLSNAIPFLTFGTIALLYLILFSTLGDVLLEVAPLVFLLAAGAVAAIYFLWFGGLQSAAGYVDGLVSVELRSRRLRRYVGWFRRKGGKILSRMRDVGDQPRKIVPALVVSHVAVVGHVGATYFALISVGADPVAHTVLLVVALSAFLTFSPTPGSVGTFEAGFAALVLLFFPVAGATATSVAILYRIGTYLPGVLLGYLGFVSLKRSEPTAG